MNDLSGILTDDFGFKPQGKSAPMASSRSSNSFRIGSDTTFNTRSSSVPSAPIFDDRDRDGLVFDDVFGGNQKYDTGISFDHDSIFKDKSSNDNANNSNAKSSSMPVFDKPVYDEDIFEGLPGLKTPHMNSSSVKKEEDIFVSISASPPKNRSRSHSAFDDLLGNFGGKETEMKESRKVENDSSSAFNDLLPGFGNSSSPKRSTRSQEPSSDDAKRPSNTIDDPFVILETRTTPPVASTSFIDPLEEFSKLSSTGSQKMNTSSASWGVFDDIDPLNGLGPLGKSVPPVSRDIKTGVNEGPLLRRGTYSYVSKEKTTDKYPVENSEDRFYSSQQQPDDSFQESHQTPFDMSASSSEFRKSARRAPPPPPLYVNTIHNETTFNGSAGKGPEEKSEPLDGDIWLTVSEVPLFTQPTGAPPPSRPPPSRPSGVSSSNLRKVNGSSFADSPQYSYSPQSARSSVKTQIDDLEDFSMGRIGRNSNDAGETLSGEDLDSNSVAAASAAAMKDAMDRAEAKFKHAKEMRDRDYLKTKKDEKSTDTQEKEIKAKEERLRREEDERALEIEREREEREKDKRRMEKERIDRERDRARQVVERANREARERAASEARTKAERAAVDKANAEARERAGRVAVQRVQAEARERAAAEARERAERAAAEARERANAEARERANAEAKEREAREKVAARARSERAAVERAAAEARERAAVMARERVAAEVRANQQRNEDNDLESFFSMGSRPSSAPRPRANAPDPAFDSQNKGGPEVSRRTSTGASSSMRKASSTTNIVDDLTSIFGASASAGEFQGVEGESEERRSARLERDQRTQDRVAKALAEKNQRDLQVQNEQAERHRIAGTLDAEIKRWAAGKEGNLRALLSTLQYVLWPECGWQPVSLTDLITGAAVKKVYRKATLCIHPDKVQQKGANLQQKYVAEKVFDLLKESWNKFNSEELF